MPQVGARLKRLDDPRMLTGRGRYVDDVTLPRMVHLAFVRSAHAHARLTRVDVDAARRAPEVAGVLTGAEAARLCKPYRGILLHYKGTVHYTNPGAWTFTNGAHLAMVEVDRETGRIRVVKYVAVDDCGRLVNPALVDGQVRGGVAQGIGAALAEHCVYDAQGQLLTTTLMDYAVPTAADLPPIEVHHLETPAPGIAGGYKGAGEGGTAGAPAAILNAVNDALAPFGVMLTEQPLTPERVLRALGRAR